MPSPRRVAAGIAAVLAALLLAAVAAAALVDWDRLTPAIEARFAEATGRQLAIDGGLDVAWTWPPGLRAQRLRIENAAWSDAPWMLDAQRVHATVRPLSLLTGGTPVPELRIEGARVRVERSADGQLNWLPAGAGDMTGSADRDAGAAPPVGRIVLADAEVHVAGIGAGGPTEVSVSSLSLALQPEDTHLELDAALDGRTLSVTASGDGLARLRGSETFEVQLRAQGLGLELEADAAVPMANLPHGISAELRIEVRDREPLARLAGIRLPRDGPLAVQGRVREQEGAWHVDALEIALAALALRGSARVVPTATPWRIEADLAAQEIDLPALTTLAVPQSRGDGAREAGADASDPALLPALPPLDGVTADVTLAVDALRTPALTWRDLHARLRLDDGVLSIEALRAAARESRIEMSARLDTLASEPVLGVDATLHDVDGATLGAALGRDWPPLADVDGDVALALHLPAEGRPLPLAPAPVLERLAVRSAELTVEPRDLAGSLQVTASTAGDGPGGALVLDARGRLGDRPRAHLHAEGAPLATLAASGEDFPLRLVLDGSQGTHAELATTLDALLDLSRFEADVTVDGPDPAALSPWIGGDLPSLPRYRAQGRVARDGAAWTVDGLDLRVGDSRLAGTLRLDVSAARPRVYVTASAPRVDLRQLAAHGTPGPEDADEDTDAGDASPGGGPLAALRALDGRAELQVAELTLPDGSVVHDTSLTAALEAGAIDVTDLEARVANGSVRGALRVDAGARPARGRLDLHLDALRAGRLMATFTPIEEQLGRASGELHLRFTGVRADRRRDDLLLPGLGRVEVEPSRLRFVDDAAGTDLALELDTEGLDAREQTMLADGQGTFRGDPFRLRFRGDPLLDLRDDEAPYALDLDVEIAHNRLRARGELDRPLALRGLDLDVELAGRDPRRLFPILGIALPSLPPYDVHGALRHAGSEWRLNGLSGTVGDSDVAGTLAVDVSGPRPRIEADLVSKRLDFDDLGGLVGAPPGTGADETAAPAQAERAQQLARTRRVLPDRPLDLRRARAVDARARFRAKRVQAGRLPLDDLAIDFRLDDGRLRFDPVRFGIGEGDVRLVIELDATRRPLDGTVQGEVRRVNLARVLRPFEIADDSAGRIGGRATLEVRGDSTAELLASADGDVRLVMTGGHLDGLLVELAGLDAGEALLSSVGDAERIAIDCALADVAARDGVFSLRTAVVDTSDTLFGLDGNIDFNDETLDITITPEPKDVSVLAARSPLEVTGPFRAPGVGVAAGPVAARVLGAAALSVIATPLAGLLALVETAPGEDSAHCAELVRAAREARRE